jgi:hypothetical protein
MTRFIKYLDIEHLGTEENNAIFTQPDDEIVVEEKVDGGNGAFWVEDGFIHVASRSRDLVAEKDNHLFALQRKKLLETLYPHFEEIDTRFIYYVEWMAKHTISYGDKIPSAIGLDIRPFEGAFGRPPAFIGRKAKEEIFEKLGVSCVALKGVFKAKEMNEKLFDELAKSSAYYSGLPEGLVFKNYGRANVWGRQMFGKVVREDFKEVNRAVFGGLKKEHSDTPRFVEAFATEARIRKAILRLTDEGVLKLDRTLMKYLPMAVAKDIFKEESDAILREFKELNFPVLKTLVAKKCLKEIDDMLLERVV